MITMGGELCRGMGGVQTDAECAEAYLGCGAWRVNMAALVELSRAVHGRMHVGHMVGLAVRDSNMFWLSSLCGAPDEIVAGDEESKFSAGLRLTLGALFNPLLGPSGGMFG